MMRRSNFWKNGFHRSLPRGNNTETKCPRAAILKEEQVSDYLHPESELGV